MFLFDAARPHRREQIEPVLHLKSEAQLLKLIRDGTKVSEKVSEMVADFMHGPFLRLLFRGKAKVDVDRLPPDDSHAARSFHIYERKSAIHEVFIDSSKSRMYIADHIGSRLIEMSLGGEFVKYIRLKDYLTVGNIHFPTGKNYMVISTSTGCGDAVEIVDRTSGALLCKEKAMSFFRIQSTDLSGDLIFVNGGRKFKFLRLNATSAHHQTTFFDQKEIAERKQMLEEQEAEEDDEDWKRLTNEYLKKRESQVVDIELEHVTNRSPDADAPCFDLVYAYEPKLGLYDGDDHSCCITHAMFLHSLPTGRIASKIRADKGDYGIFTSRTIPLMPACDNDEEPIDKTSHRLPISISNLVTPDGRAIANDQALHKVSNPNTSSAPRPALPIQSAWQKSKKVPKDTIATAGEFILAPADLPEFLLVLANKPNPVEGEWHTTVPRLCVLWALDGSLAYEFPDISKLIIRPSSFSYDPINNHIFVACGEKHAIYVFSLVDGSVRKIGGGDAQYQLGEFDSPTATLNGDTLYVADSENFRLQCLAPYLFAEKIERYSDSKPYTRHVDSAVTRARFQEISRASATPEKDIDDMRIKQMRRAVLRQCDDTAFVLPTSSGEARAALNNRDFHSAMAYEAVYDIAWGGWT